MIMYRTRRVDVFYGVPVQPKPACSCRRCRRLEASDLSRSERVSSEMPKEGDPRDTQLSLSEMQNNGNRNGSVGD